VRHAVERDQHLASQRQKKKKKKKKTTTTTKKKKVEVRSASGRRSQMHRRARELPCYW
jgi:hypothetical protein